LNQLALIQPNEFSEARSPPASTSVTAAPRPASSSPIALPTMPAPTMAT
jgi:hypothetical protein